MTIKCLVSIQVMPAVKIVTKTIGCIINADGLGTEVNKEGIMYYNNLINYLLEKGSSFPSNSAGYSPPGSVAGSLAWEGRPLPRSRYRQGFATGRINLGELEVAMVKDFEVISTYTPKK
ncbi:putative beta-glucosidase [Helianthus annuus]|nr:putative beta-glucosidase [Helianthus annuus]KAJ0519138.1 putative beta-glucosidase [Helianthus annuus]KAJ0872597.1 putative beta-glucosidase [Helianthus annuus]